MSNTQEVSQEQACQVTFSDDDPAIMDFTDPEKEPESEAEVAGNQSDSCERRRGRCHRRKLLRRQMETQDGGCYLRSYHERKMVRRMFRMWARKMMWRRMMFRMCYGGPLGMGYGCRRRRMMSAAMMDSTGTSSDDSGDGRWRHRHCSRREKCGRRFGKGKRGEDQTSDNQKVHDKGEKQDVHTPPQENSQNTASNFEQTESAAGGGTHDKRVRRKERMMRKCMRRVHFCETSGDSTSDSSTSSSSSESPSDDGKEEPKEKKSEEHGRCCRRGRRRPQRQQIDAEGKEVDKCTKGRKVRNVKRRMMRMGRRGYFKSFC